MSDLLQALVQRVTLHLEAIYTDVEAVSDYQQLANQLIEAAKLEDIKNTNCLLTKASPNIRKSYSTHV